MTAVIECVILGAGGHAAMVLEILRHQSVTLGVIDRNAAALGATWNGIRVLGDDELLAQLACRGTLRFAIGLGGVGDNAPRARLFNRAIDHGLHPIAVHHPSAIVSPEAVLGEGVQLLPGCIVNWGSRLGRNVIVNTGAIVEHDCRIGDHVHVSSGAVLAGAVTVGALAHIGAGATVRQGIVIGERAIVGAGSVVVKNVAPGAVVAGVPAGPLPERSE
ncbi:MAG: acetyltransferase [Thermoanaerobaculia bacterium]